jgi:hypothetical protein
MGDSLPPPKLEHGLDWRPESYWEWPGVTSPNIGGAIRRTLLHDAVRRGVLEDVPPAMFADTLGPSLREHLGRIHPALMGGEYLPRLRPGEVEIARIVLQSVTLDVISVRARPVGTRIAYRVVDEQAGACRYECRPRTSARPLTLQGLIQLLDTCRQCSDDEVFAVGLLEAFWRGCELETPEEATAFAVPESSFYQDLDAWYSHRAAVFAMEWRRPTAGE